MKKMKVLIITLFISYIIRSECGKGCLKCNPDNECLICDLNNYFIMSSDSLSCVKKILDNCEKIDENGNCLVCN